MSRRINHTADFFGRRIGMFSLSRKLMMLVMKKKKMKMGTWSSSRRLMAFFSLLEQQQMFFFWAVSFSLSLTLFIFIINIFFKKQLKKDFIFLVLENRDCSSGVHWGLGDGEVDRVGYSFVVSHPHQHTDALEYRLEAANEKEERLLW